MLSKWLRSFYGTRSRLHRRATGRSAVRIRLNELEGRDVPSTLTLGLTTSPVNEGQSTTLNGTIGDPPANPFAVLIDWGDGQKQTVNLNGGATSFSTNHLFVDDNPTATNSDTHAITGDLYTVDGTQITFGTAVRMGAIGSDRAAAIALDASGNVYTTGFFQGTVDFDPGVGTANLTSDGNSDVFVTKFDPAGNFIWAKRLGGTGVDKGAGLAVDAGGNVLVTGNFEFTVDFDPGLGTYNLSSVNKSDAFVTKLNPFGEFVWARSFGGEGADDGAAIAIGPANSVFLTGSFFETVDFDPGAGTVELVSAGDSDIYVVKLDSAGTYVWATRMGGNFTDSGKAIAVDGAGNVFTTGEFGNLADFDPGAGEVLLSVAGGNDAFLCKQTSTGSLAWAHGFGGVDFDIGTGVAVDADGNVYATGNFNDAVDFNPGAGDATRTSAGSIDAYVVKFTTAGVFGWVGSVGGTSFDFSSSIALDVYGNIYVTGGFSATADFDPGAGTANRTAVGFIDAYTVKWSNNGAFVWAQQQGGGSVDVGNAIAVNGLSDVYVAGEFSGTVDFNPTGGTFNLVSAGGSDAFVSRLRQSTFVTNASTNVTVNNVAPTVSAGPDGFIQPGGTFTQSGSFTDPSPTDTFTATVNYGDGSGTQALTLNPDRTFNLNHTYAAFGLYTVTVSVTDDDGGIGTDTARVFVGTPPAVESMVINDGATQRSMVTTLQVNFSSEVTIGSGAFTIRDPLNNAIAATINVSTQVVSGKTVATLTFSGTGIVGGSLADGRWRLNIDDALITDSNNGLPMAADYVSAQFFRRFGDNNANQIVDNVDQIQFRQSYGSSFGQPAFRKQFDYNNNNVIDNIDQLQFRQRYGIALP
jgi:hypothetical protein